MKVSIGFKMFHGALFAPLSKSNKLKSVAYCHHSRLVKEVVGVKNARVEETNFDFLVFAVVQTLNYWTNQNGSERRYVTNLRGIVVLLSVPYSVRIIFVKGYNL